MTTATATIRNPATVLATLGVGVMLAFLTSLALGSVSFALSDVAKALIGGEVSTSVHTVVWAVRLPKALTALSAGAALGVAGLAMQTVFRNPLAGPYVLGVSAGASLGVALVVLGAGAGLAGWFFEGLGLFGGAGMAIAASAGAGVVLVLILLASRRVGTLTLLILGVLFGYATGAVVTVLLHLSAAERIETYLRWTFGSFGGVTWDRLAILAPAVLIGLTIAQLAAKALNALLLGPRYARSMGLAVRRAQTWIFVATALLAGVVTAFCGPIGFLGVAVPHLARGLLGSSDHRVLVPAAALAGALTALVADLVAQLPGWSVVLPLNAVTALLGAPVIGWIVLRRRDVEAAFE